jgi:CubicO group peptidase (beta-lactamase class C family)
MSAEHLAHHGSGAARLTRRDALGLAAAVAAGGIATAAAPPTAVVAASPGRANARSAQSPNAQFSGLDEAIRAAMAEAGVPGAAVGVLYQGQEYVAGFGVTNVNFPLPVTGDSLFQIGSVSKTFTMAAAMRLVERGRLDLDTPVRSYLPDLRFSDPDATARVTMRQLLSHTSGLPADDFAVMGGGDDALARYVAEVVSRAPLILPVGLYPSYSNVGLSLAGRVIEVVSGSSYESAIGDLLFEPLGMATATFFAEDAITAATAAGHTVVDGQAYVQRPWALPRTANAAGGITASVNEMLRYARMWLAGGTGPDGTRLLSTESLAQIGTPQSRAPADLGTFGLSWALADVGGVHYWSHDGGTMGQNSRLTLAREQDFALCALTNVPDGSMVLGAATGWLTEHLLGAAATAVPEPTPLALDNAALAEYAADYDNPGETLNTLRVRDGGLEIVSVTTDPLFAGIQPPLPDSPPLQLAFSAPDEVYAVVAPRARGAFLRAPDGRITGLFWSGRFYVRSV